MMAIVATRLSIMYHVEVSDDHINPSTADPVKALHFAILV